jgi:hypothetical protein
MGWLNEDVFDRLKAYAESLPADRQRLLTWEEASYFVAADTLDIAKWTGLLRRTDLTPYEAVKILRGIK